MGAIFAATDSVATLQVLDRDTMPELFSLVFGEGVVNDAVSVVLLGAVASTAKMKEAPAAGNDAPSSAFAGRSFVLTFVYLLLTSLVLGTVAGLGIAAALKKLALHDAHQVGNLFKQQPPALLMTTECFKRQPCNGPKDIPGIVERHTTASGGIA